MVDYLKHKVKGFWPGKVHSISDAMEMMSGCGFQGRNLGDATRVFTEMVDEGCFNVLTLSGAMVPAGMGPVICAMVEHGMIDAIVSTGANIIHSIVNSFAQDQQAHYLGTQDTDDHELHRQGINRIYDLFLPEVEYENTEEKILELLSQKFDPGEHTLTPSAFLKLLGSSLDESSFVGLCARRGVPIFCGALSDSELALNLAKYRKSGITIILDEIGDVDVFADLVGARESHGIFIVGGGVPRNWAQQVFPYLDQTRGGGQFKGYKYSVRLHTATAYDGGLSGCTIKEGVSWGKYSSETDHAAVWVDATIALPLIVTATLERRNIE